MVHVIWSLILAAVLLMGAVIVPIWMDRLCEHAGATDEWADKLHAWVERDRARSAS